MVDYQHTFSPSLLTEARFAFSRLIISELQPDYNTDAATNAGIPDINLGTVYTSGLPQMNVSDPISAFNMGDFGLPFFEREANFEFYDNWTKTFGPPRIQVRCRCRKVFRHPNRRQRARSLLRLASPSLSSTTPSCTGTLFSRRLFAGQAWRHLNSAFPLVLEEI